MSKDASTTLTVLTQTFDILGRVCMARNPDSGAKLIWRDVASATLRSWDEPNTPDERSQTFTFDALRRPLTCSVTANGSTYLAELTTYGENLSNAKARNARGQAYSHKDGAGIATDEQRDFHGKVTKSVRQLTTDAKTIPDWSKNVGVDETFTTTTAYDALGRVIQIDTPHNTSVPASQVIPIYNEANLLDKVQLKLRGAAIATDIVTNIDYDPLTYRLTRLLTTRNSGTEKLQDLAYTYDATGNVVQITDDAQQTTFFNNQVIWPDALYEYDATYRLTKSTGREHINNGVASEPEAEGFNAPQNLPSDGQSLRNYTRAWTYDHVGNILALIHQASGGNWTRSYTYASDSNRLASTTAGTVTQTYTHNAYGSFQNLPHLNGMTWTPDEHLHTIKRGTSQTWYTYDSTGQRVRKVTDKGGITEERLYLGGFEIYRKRQGATVTLERETLHLMDGARRIALVETKTVDTSTTSPLPVTVTRYQLDNHLQSATLELDETAQVISYEEYYPYGDTSYRSVRSGVEVSEKRYRYTGKEKDEESGLYYHGARYYAAWLGRWTAADPAGMVDGACLYAYVRNHPTGLVDPDGRASDSTDQTRHMRDRNLDESGTCGGRTNCIEPGKAPARIQHHPQFEKDANKNNIPQKSTSSSPSIYPSNTTEHQSSSPPSTSPGRPKFIESIENQYKDPIKQATSGSGLGISLAQEATSHIGKKLGEISAESLKESTELLTSPKPYKSSLRVAEAEAAKLAADAKFGTRVASGFGKTSKTLRKLGFVASIASIQIEWELGKDHSKESLQRAWFTGLAGVAGVALVSVAITGAAALAGISLPFLAAAGITIAGGMLITEFASYIAGEWWDSMGSPK